MRESALYDAQHTFIEMTKEIQKLLDLQRDGLDTDEDWIALKPYSDEATRNLWAAGREHLKKRGLWDRQMAASWARCEQRENLHMGLTTVCMNLKDEPWTGARVVTVKLQKL